MDFLSLSNGIARYDHANSALRILLCKNEGKMSVEEALMYTCHSWRHLYPTMARQLKLPNDAVTEMGHWGPSSGMAARYDSAKGVMELLNKRLVTSAAQAGWIPAELHGTQSSSSHLVAACSSGSQSVASTPSVVPSQVAGDEGSAVASKKVEDFCTCAFAVCVSSFSSFWHSGS